VIGRIALHGGGEFLRGDERFLAAILAVAPRSAGVVRVAVVPTAAARGRPELAAANGVAACERVGERLGLHVEAEMVAVVDGASANDPTLADRIGGAGLIHFPGGDPDLIPTLLRDTPVWAAVRGALAGGAVLAGASAGAMAMGTWTWTPRGGIAGLDLVPGIAVVPHADARSWADNLHRFGDGAPQDLAILGLGERTGVLIDSAGTWRVVGEAEVRWLPRGERDPNLTLVLGDGDALPRGDADGHRRGVDR
jgi:cyanophycinase-like exopeptidase